MKKIIVIWPNRLKTMAKKVVSETSTAELLVFIGFTGIFLTSMCVVVYSLAMNLKALF